MVRRSDAADTHRATGRFASYACRDFGVRESIPLVLLQRFRVTWP